MNAQIAEKQEALTNSTYRVSISAENEAIVMRIITVVTLLFLPATFVSTVFSTPMVNFQQSGSDSGVQNSGGPSVGEADAALHTWLKISLPLTAATCIIAYAVYSRTKKHRQRRREEEQSEKYFHEVSYV